MCIRDRASLYDAIKIGSDFEHLRWIVTTDSRPGVPLGDGALFVLHPFSGQRRPGDVQYSFEALTAARPVE
eukprot:595796-Karenia_brevis.AAC.1